MYQKYVLPYKISCDIGHNSHPTAVYVCIKVTCEIFKHTHGKSCLCTAFTRCLTQGNVKAVCVDMVQWIPSALLFFRLTFFPILREGCVADEEVRIFIATEVMMKCTIFCVLFLAAVSSAKKSGGKKSSSSDVPTGDDYEVAVCAYAADYGIAVLYDVSMIQW